MTITRRSVLAATAGAGVMSAIGWDSAQAQAGVRTRYGAATPRGKQMLVQYAKAVGLMMDNSKFPRTDPRSWDFQWYTHWIPGPQQPWSAVVQAKQNMLNQVFAGKPPNDPNRLLAQAMWDDCQAHGNNTNDPNFFQEMYFCVWHRWYVYYFEEIIRGVLQNPTFTLPYWNYLSGDVKDLSIPPEFLVQNSPLFRSNRNPWVNAGERIDKNNPGVLNLNCFNETIYIDSPDGGIGFCPIIDNNPHGQVHGLVGNLTNMGRVPTAAGDPIFWLHHCNIDRLWESWNRIPGRNNPAWPNRRFPFADANGKAVTVLPKDANRVAQLKYQYDFYYVPPKKPAPLPLGAPSAALAAAAVTKVTRAAAEGEVTLASERVRVELTPPPSPTAGLTAATPRPIAPSGPSNRLYLVLAGIVAAPDDDSTYNVFLDLPEGQGNPPTSDPHYVGTLNFFNAAGHEEHGAAGHKTTFNVTDTVKALQAKSQPSAKPSVTLVRRGDAKGANPIVRQIYLMES
jgi:tyrosinase